MQTETISVARAPIAGFLRAVSARIAKVSRRVLAGREARRLHLNETLSLGNRGYLAVVCYGEQRFLIGGTNNSITLLAQLSTTTSLSGTRTEDESTCHSSNIG